MSENDKPEERVSVKMTPAERMELKKSLLIFVKSGSIHAHESSRQQNESVIDAARILLAEF